jgi:NitT/TauT family transport system permease protein
MAELARRAAAAVLPVLALGLLWEGSVWLFAISPFYLPRLSVVLGTIATSAGAFRDAFLTTLAEAVTGYVAGALVGIASGIVFAHSRWLREMFFPLFIVSQTVPVIAFGAIVVLWFGNTLLAKAAIAFYLTFFPVTVNTLVGLTSVDERQVALLRSFGATTRQLLWTLRFPAALPRIFVALRLSAALALVGAMVGEWFGATTGIGVMLLQAMFNEQVPALWASILSAAVLGTALYAGVAAAEKRLVFWKEEL